MRLVTLRSYSQYMVCCVQSFSLLVCLRFNTPLWCGALSSELIPDKHFLCVSKMYGRVQWHHISRCVCHMTLHVESHTTQRNRMSNPQQGLTMLTTATKHTINRKAKYHLKAWYMYPSMVFMDIKSVCARSYLLAVQK